MCGRGFLFWGWAHNVIPTFFPLSFQLFSTVIPKQREESDGGRFARRSLGGRGRLCKAGGEVVNHFFTTSPLEWMAGAWLDRFSAEEGGFVVKAGGEVVNHFFTTSPLAWMAGAWLDRFSAEEGGFAKWVLRSLRFGREVKVGAVAGALQDGFRPLRRRLCKTGVEVPPLHFVPVGMTRKGGRQDDLVWSFGKAWREVAG